MTIRHNGAGTVESRRGFIIPASKGSNGDAQPGIADVLIVRVTKWPHNGANGQVVSFSSKCCLCATSGGRPANGRPMGYDHHGEG